MIDNDKIVSSLLNLKHRGNIKAPVLAQELGISEATLRDHVKDLRRKGIPIKSGSFGYGFARDIEDIQDTLKHLKSRAKSELVTIMRLEKNFVNPNSQDSLFYISPIDELIEEIQKERKS